LFSDSAFEVHFVAWSSRYSFVASPPGGEVFATDAGETEVLIARATALDAIAGGLGSSEPSAKRRV
jgi:hypothetical protein